MQGTRAVSETPVCNFVLVEDSIQSGRVMVKRIFVVDDENCVADTLAVIFRKAGYDAQPARSGGTRGSSQVGRQNAGRDVDARN